MGVFGQLRDNYSIVYRYWIATGHTLEIIFITKLEMGRLCTHINDSFSNCYCNNSEPQ